MAPNGEEHVDLTGGPARLLKAPYWGTLAVVAALGLNPIFMERALDALSMGRPWPHILALLGAISGILVFGVAWQPFCAARRNQTLAQSIHQLMGRLPAIFICWVLIPVALLHLFHMHFHTLHWLAVRALEHREIFPRGSSAWPWLGIATTVLLGLLAWLGCWDNWSGFGRSAIWLVQVSLMGWLGLVLSFLPGIPAGALRVREGWAMDFDFSIGVFLLWFGLPLLLMGHRFAAALPSHRAVMRGVPLWLALTTILFVVYLLVRYLYFGMLGTYPKFTGLLGGLALGTRLASAKAMVLCLAMLVTLRLGPRLLADLWKVAPRSHGLALLVAAAVVLSMNAPSNWLTDDMLAELGVVLGALAGTLNGAEWGATMRRHAGGRLRQLASRETSASTWRRWCLGIWLGGILLPAIIPRHRNGVLAAIWELSQLPFREVVLNVAASLYGLVPVWDFHWVPHFYSSAATIIIAWLLCFMGAFALGFRHGMPKVSHANGIPAGQPE